MREQEGINLLSAAAASSAATVPPLIPTPFSEAFVPPMRLRRVHCRRHGAARATEMANSLAKKLGKSHDSKNSRCAEETAEASTV